ncbi:MAG: hypothetical protein ACJ71W_15325 [Terriglobales bacterium]
MNTKSIFMHAVSAMKNGSQICKLRSCGFLLLLSVLSIAMQLPARAQQRKPAAPKPLGATLLIQTDSDCMITLDDQPAQVMQLNETKKIAMSLGEHLLGAVSTDGKDHWKTVVALDKPVQKVVLIELLKVRAARESSEHEARQLQQTIQAKTEQAQALREKTDKLKQAQGRLEQQIAELQKQARQEESAAQSDEYQAQQMRQQAMAGAAQGTNLGNFTAALGNVGVNNAMNSATAHRARASQIQNQITDLNLKLERVKRGETVEVPANPNALDTADPAAARIIDSLSDECKQVFSQYQGAALNKAFAISSRGACGYGYSAITPERAQELALSTCKKRAGHHNDCHIVIVNIAPMN